MVFLGFLMTNVLGQGGDPWQTMWRFEEKGNGGVQEFWQDITGAGEARLANLSVWPWMPLHYIFGEPLAYNVIWLLHIILAGYAMALFIKILTRSEKLFSPAPILAGIAYMLLPYRSAHALGHFGAMQLAWIPFICAAVLIYIRNPRIWKIVVLGLLLTVQAWTEHHYALWLGIFAVIAGVVYKKELLSHFHPTQPPLEKGRGSRSLPLFKGELEGVRSVLLLLLILFFGVVIPYIPTIKLAVTNNEALNLGAEQRIRFSADLFSFITPSPQHPVWGAFFDTLFGQYFTGNNAESVQYLGVSIIIVLLFFHKHIPVKQKRLWIWTIIVFGLIALGPVLHIFGRETSLPLPYALIANLPVFSAIRTVARAGVMIGFATCVLFGWVIATNKHKPRTAIVGGVIILLAEFMFIPFPMQSAQLSPAYEVIRELPGSKIIELPAATNYTAASRALYASALHRKSVLGNIALERGESQDVYVLVKSLPAIRQLLYLRTTELLENRPEFFGQDIAETLPDAMKYMDAYAILVHTDSLSVTQKEAVASLLDINISFAKQSFGDTDLYVLNAQDAKSDGVFLIRNTGFEHVGFDPKRQSVFAEIQNTATVTFVNTSKNSARVKIQYTVPPESQGHIVLPDSFDIQPGETTVTLRNEGSGTAIIQNPSFTILP